MNVIDRLLELQSECKIDVHAYNDEAFKNACLNEEQELIDRLLKLDGFTDQKEIINDG